MSEAMKCDRCGKYVDGSDIPTIRGWRTETARRVGSPMLKMDLCNECYETLEEFLVKGDEDNDATHNNG